MGLLHLLFSFHGRIGRSQYWLGVLLASGLVFFSFMMMGGDAVGALGKSAPAPSLFGALASLACSVLSTWWSLAVQVKRFHDRGRTGYWTLAPLLPLTMIVVSLIGSIAAGASFAQMLSSIGGWAIAFWALSLWFFIELGCLGSKPGPNKYGDPPGTPASLAPTSAAPASAASAARAPMIPGLAKPAPAAPAANAFTGAEQAIARAIAERANPAAPAPVAATPRAATTGFGRKAAR